ncbi:hypothetical protein D3C74_488540 [compost metagenome]
MDALHRGGGPVEQFALHPQHLANGVDQEGAYPFAAEQQAVFHRIPQAWRHGGQCLKLCRKAVVDAAPVQAGEIV